MTAYVWIDPSTVTELLNFTVAVLLVPPVFGRGLYIPRFPWAVTVPFSSMADVGASNQSAVFAPASSFCFVDVLSSTMSFGYACPNEPVAKNSCDVPPASVLPWIVTVPVPSALGASTFTTAFPMRMPPEWPGLAAERTSVPPPDTVRSPEPVNAVELVTVTPGSIVMVDASAISPNATVPSAENVP